MRKLKMIIPLFFLLLTTQVVYAQVDSCVLKETVQMKDQIWMTKNLDVTTFQNGDTILHAPSFESWVAAGKKGIPAWCYYNNDSILGKQLGKIYNWYAANDKRELAPAGWKIPNFDEVNVFLDFIGRDPYSADRLASREWTATGGVDLYGFRAKPAGSRSISYNLYSISDTVKDFVGLDWGVGYWMKGPYTKEEGYALLLNMQEAGAHIYGKKKTDGLYIRCIKKE